MRAEALLERLAKVKETGSGRWLACCPAHPDKTPSLAVRELEDDRVLVHCFAGCIVEDVLAAVGLDFDALFPEKATADHFNRLRKPFPAADVLEALANESHIVLMHAAKLRNGEALEPEDMQRLVMAVSLIEEGRLLANGVTR